MADGGTISSSVGDAAPHIPRMFWSRASSGFDQRPCERSEHNSTSTQLVTRSRSERDGETLHAGIDTRGVHPFFVCVAWEHAFPLAIFLHCQRIGTAERRCSPEERVTQNDGDVRDNCMAMSTRRACSVRTTTCSFRCDVADLAALLLDRMPGCLRLWSCEGTRASVQR